jgi:hypothetical protein
MVTVSVKRHSEPKYLLFVFGSNSRAKPKFFLSSSVTFASMGGKTFTFRFVFGSSGLLLEAVLLELEPDVVVGVVSAEFAFLFDERGVAEFPSTSPVSMRLVLSRGGGESIV